MCLSVGPRPPRSGYGPARHEVSEQQVFEAELAATSAKILLQTAEAQLHAMLIGPRPEAVAEAESKITVADGAVAFSKAHLDFHTIGADRRCGAHSLTCHPGQTMAIGTPIGEIVDTRHFHLHLPALRIRPGGPRRAEGPGQDRRVASGVVRRGGAETPDWKGRSTSLAALPMSRPATCRYSSWLRTRPGATRADHGRDDYRGRAFRSARSALSRDPRPGRRSGLDRRPERQNGGAAPQVGTSQGGWVAISKTDLEEGEPVIVEGGYNLPEGTAVKTEEATGKAEAKEGKAEAKEGKTEGATVKPDKTKTKAGSEHEE